MAAAPARKSGSNYDRGEAQALALSRVLRGWRTARPDLSLADISGRIARQLGKHYWPNDVQRAMTGDLRMSHLRPRVVEAYCIALERTDLDSMTEAFFAAELKPPEVTADALKLAIATSRGAQGRRSA